MYIDKVYLQENYRRHPGDDPFLFGTVGVGVHINEGESVEEAEQKAKQYIQDYIERHTHYPEHNHVEVKDVQVQKTTEQGIEQQIIACSTINELTEFLFLANMNPQLKKAYNDTYNRIIGKTTVES